jgi:hypothetical protein
MIMSDPNKPDAIPPMSAWSLEPQPGDAVAPAAATAPVKGRSNFHANTREGCDRRVQGERRETLRFQDDRRTGKDRRPRKSWTPGSNL